MKINDFIHVYKRTICRVRTFRTYINNNKKYILLTELNENQGPSVTNSIEYLIQSLINQGYAELMDTFIEHYPKIQFFSEEFDEVELGEFNSPTWHGRSKEKVMLLINENADDFDIDTEKDQKSKIDILKSKYEDLKFMDNKFIEDSSIITRREKIRKNMITKEYLRNLINSKPKESEIGSILKKDLSIFAEVYARPEDEYICFSEFPFFQSE